MWTYKRITGAITKDSVPTLVEKWEVLFDNGDADDEYSFDHVYDDREEAARRVNYLNGGLGLPFPATQQLDNYAKYLIKLQHGITRMAEIADLTLEEIRKSIEDELSRSGAKEKRA